MIRKLLLLLYFIVAVFCSTIAPSDAQAPPPPPPGGGGGGEIIPPVPPIPPVIPPVPPVPPVPPISVIPTFTPPVLIQTPTPTAAAPQVNIPQFNSSTILPTDTLPFKVNGPMQVRLSQGKGMTTNFSVLLDEKSMLLVVAEKTQYTSETPIANPRVVTSTSTPEDNSPNAVQKREQEQQLLQDSLLMKGYDNELAAPQTEAPKDTVQDAVDDTTAQPADDTTTSKVEPVAPKQAKRTVMQKIKSFLHIGGAKPKTTSAQPAESKENACPAKSKSLKTKVAFKLPASPSTFELTTGAMLVKAHEPVKVKVAGKEVYVMRDATALIMTDGKQLKVITLNNRCGKSVYVVLDDKRHHLEIPLQQLWKFEDNKLARLRAIVTVEKDKDPRQPKIEQWEADRMMLNQILVSHPLVSSFARPKSPYANHKCMKQFQKTIAAFAVVNAQKRKALGRPMEVPPQPGTYTIWDHFFVK